MQNFIDEFGEDLDAGRGTWEEFLGVLDHQFLDPCLEEARR